MTDADYPVASTLEAARTAPIPEGQSAAELMRHGTLRLLYYDYAPKGTDAQKPRDQDVLCAWRTVLCDGRRL